MKYRASNLIKAIIILLLITLIGVVKRDVVSYDEITSNEVLALSINSTEEYDNVTDFIYNNFEIFNYYAKTFAIDLENIESLLIMANKGKTFNKNDIANSGVIYDSLEVNIIEYLFDLEDKHPELFNNNVVKNTRSKYYIYNLINYYCNLYELDYQLLASISYVETGNMKANNMLSKNNVYGGMTYNKQLIGYKNINYGVLTYVRMMKYKYIDKGLDTVDKIGYVFNPIVINGVKTVNPHWLGHVNSTLPKFDNTIKITCIKDLDNAI